MIPLDIYSYPLIFSKNTREVINAHVRTYFDHLCDDGNALEHFGLWRHHITEPREIFIIKKGILDGRI